MAAEALALRDLVKTFGATRALDGANLIVERGTIHGLIGQNDAGKSTIIKILNGLYRADAGIITIDGQTPPSISPRVIEHFGVHIIHQEALLPPSFTMAEALFLGAEPSHGPILAGRTMRRRAEEVIGGYFDLTLPRGALIGELSAAQRQIVQITRALLNRPRVLVFDEPTAALVRREANRLFGLIRRLRDEGATVKSYVPLSGNGFLLDAIGAVFVGTTISREAKPNVLGTLLGVFLFGMLHNGLLLIGWNFYWQQVAVGLLVFCVLGASFFSRRLQTSNSPYSINDTTSDNYGIGEKLALQLASDIKGKGNILVFNGFYSVPVCAIRYDELKLVLRAFPDIHIIQPELRDVIPNTVQSAYSQVTDMLQKYPNKGDVAAIWSAWDVPQVGATQAIVAAHRPEVRTYGVDGSPDVVKMVADPTSPAAAVAAQQPYVIGKTAVDNVARYLAGNHDLPPYTFIPSILVTKLNATDAAKALGQS